jgi:MFS family permease
MNLMKKNGYLKGNLSQGFISLYTGKMITIITYGISSIFLPIFLYKTYDEQLKYVVLFYVVGIWLYIFSVAYGARFLNKFGFRRALRLSVIFGALFYLSFYFINESNINYLIIFPIIALTLFRLTYWLPYHIDFAKFTSKKERGKQLSILESTRLIISVVSPLVFGFLIAKFGFQLMFLFGVFIYLMSGIPYLSIPRTKEKYSWSYMDTWKQFFAKENRGVVIAYMADGAENVVGVIIWPIFIWELLNGDVLQVGIISTLIVGISVILQLILGKYTDKMDKKKMLKLGSIFHAFGWIAKIFVVTTFQIFITATYHNLSKIFIRTPFDVLTYEMAADEGHYVDEFTVIHEIAIGMGKSLMLLLILFFSMFASLQWTFILGALAALLYNTIEFNKLKREVA